LKVYYLEIPYVLPINICKRSVQNGVMQQLQFVWCSCLNSLLRQRKSCLSFVFSWGLFWHW